jgi:predicted DNA-binding protein
MLVNVSIKMPPKMKKALEKLAEKEFTTVSGLLKKAAEKYLQEHGIDWRKEKPKK